jgi:hypothetical protein
MLTEEDLNSIRNIVIEELEQRFNADKTDTVSVKLKQIEKRLDYFERRLDAIDKRDMIRMKRRILRLSSENNGGMTESYRKWKRNLFI